jgi:hypothetical protein
MFLTLEHTSCIIGERLRLTAYNLYFNTKFWDYFPHNKWLCLAASALLGQMQWRSPSFCLSNHIHRSWSVLMSHTQHFFSMCYHLLTPFVRPIPNHVVTMLLQLPCNHKLDLFIFHSIICSLEIWIHENIDQIKSFGTQIT